MNREIKFRGLDAETGELIDDFLYLIDLNVGYAYYRDSVGNPQRCKVSSLMQYTGLKDKNGRDIFEGDVLHEKREKTAPMANNAIERVFTLLDIRNSYTFDPDNCVVVGNIHQHPELLNS